MPRKISRTIASRPSYGRVCDIDAGRTIGCRAIGCEFSCEVGVRVPTWVVILTPLSTKGVRILAPGVALVLFGWLDSLDHDAAIGNQRGDCADCRQPGSENGAGHPDGQW